MKRCIDRLAGEYEVSHANELSKPLSERVYFAEYCYEKLPPAINQWVEELLVLLKKAKAQATPFLPFTACCTLCMIILK